MNNLIESAIPPTGAQQKDNYLWEIAKKRAGFKWSFVSYIFVNGFLVAIWFLTSGSFSNFWPIWPILGWGLGLAFQYLHAYHGNSIFSVQQEYDKLKNNDQQ